MKGDIMAKKKKTKGKKKRSRRAEAIETAVPSSGRSKKLNGIELYLVESALETMTRAEEIQKDEKLMKATEKLLKRRQVALDKVERSLKNRS